jgi:hypothetical protein
LMLCRGSKGGKKGCSFSAVVAGSEMRNSWYRLHSAALIRARASTFEKVEGVIEGQSARVSRLRRRRFVRKSEDGFGPEGTRGADFVRL